MNVLMLVKRFDVGGAEDHVLELTNNLCTLGIKVHLACKPGRKISELHPDVTLHSFHFKKILIPFNVFRLLILIKKENIDLIHAHQKCPIALASIISCLTGIPALATIHGLLRKEIGLEFIQKHLTKVIVVSKNSLKGTQKYSFIKNKTVLIHNGLAKIPFNQNGCDKNKIVYACRIDSSHYSFLKFLINEVMPVLRNYNKNISLQIIGDGLKLKFLKKIADSFNSEHGEQSVTLYGYSRNIKEIISTAGLVIGVGRVAMQALSIGIPVISANRKHLGSIITTRNYEYMRDNNFVSVDYPPPSSIQISGTILQLFRHYNYYKEETTRLKIKVNTDFNLTSILFKTISVYQNCNETRHFPQPQASFN